MYTLSDRELDLLALLNSRSRPSEKKSLQFKECAIINMNKICVVLTMPSLPPNLLSILFFKKGSFAVSSVTKKTTCHDLQLKKKQQKHIKSNGSEGLVNK